MDKLLPLLVLMLSLGLTSRVPAFPEDNHAKVIVDLHPVSEGSLKRGTSTLRSIKLTAAKPAELKKGLGEEAAIYGILPVRASKYGMLVAIIESADAKAGKIYLDANGDGDLTNDKATHWEPLGTPAFGGLATVEIAEGPVTLRLFRYTPEFYNPDHKPDKKIPDRPLYYSREDAREGKAIFGEKTYTLALTEFAATGRYDLVKHDGKNINVGLYIDRNGNDHFERDFELYDLGLPFTLAGKTYELDAVAANGSTLSFRRSQSSVPERPLPLSAVGQPGIAFRCQSLDGKLVRFPKDYRGKIVLLDFWSQGCVPCMRAKPELARAFARHHERDFEVLGVCLDKVDELREIRDVCLKHGMTWPQLYDGQSFDGPVAKCYGVRSLPCAFLLDGTTGILLATPEDLRRDNIEVTLSKVLAIREGLRESLKQTPVEE